jgi:hypothetical protein
MKDTRPKAVGIHTRSIPRHRKDEFRAWCSGRGYTMGAVMVSFLRRCLAEDKSLRDARHPPRPAAGARTTWHCRAVPPHLKAQFKAWCARRGYTMEAAVMACMARAVAEDRAIPGIETPVRMGS